MQPGAWISVTAVVLAGAACADRALELERGAGSTPGTDASADERHDAAEGEPDAAERCVPVPWTTTTVDAHINRGAGSSIAVDPAGSVHISYAGADGVRYAHGGGGAAWTTRMVEPNGFQPPGWPTSLVLDPSGGVHIAYSVPGKPSDHPATDSSAWLRYAFGDGVGGWTTETIDPLGGDGSLVIDSGGRLHVAYVRFSGWSLQYASRSAGGAWVASSLLDTDLDRHPAVALDGTGAVHVVYTSGLQTIIYLRRDPNGTGTSAAVDAARSEGGALAVDAAGGVHLGYQSAQGIGYARRDPTGTWAITTVDPDPILVSGGYSLAVDPEGGVHMSYVVIPERALRYAHRDPGGAWTTTTIEAAVVNLWGTSLAVDPQGGVHISYAANGGLRYAYSRRCVP